MKTYYCVCTSYDDRGRVVSNIVDTAEAARRPENSYKSTSRKDIYLDWFDSLNAARAHVEGEKVKAIVLSKIVYKTIDN